MRRQHFQFYRQLCDGNDKIIVALAHNNGYKIMEFSVGRDYCVAYVMIMKEKERRTNTSEWSRPIREERRIFRHIR